MITYGAERLGLSLLKAMSDQIGSIHARSTYAIEADYTR